MPVDIANYQMVAVRGVHPDIRLIVMRPKLEMTTDEALAFAAWLVALTSREDEFPAILAAVCDT